MPIRKEVPRLVPIRVGDVEYLYSTLIIYQKVEEKVETKLTDVTLEQTLTESIEGKLTDVTFEQTLTQTVEASLV